MNYMMFISGPRLATEKRNPYRLTGFASSEWNLPIWLHAISAYSEGIRPGIPTESGHHSERSRPPIPTGKRPLLGLSSERWPEWLGKLGSEAG